MSHLDEVRSSVDAVIEQGIIAPMNELLIALSDDADLSRDERYCLLYNLRAHETS